MFSPEELSIAIFLGMLFETIVDYGFLFIQWVAIAVCYVGIIKCTWKILA